MTRIIEAGSKKSYLQNLAIEIYNECIANNITLHAVWVPREHYKMVDLISKSPDTNNWSIDGETFNYIKNCFGKFTVDKFADDLNTKNERFNSKHYCPNTMAVDKSQRTGETN